MFDFKAWLVNKRPTKQDFLNSIFKNYLVFREKLLES